MRKNTKCTAVILSMVLLLSACQNDTSDSSGTSGSTTSETTGSQAEGEPSTDNPSSGTVPVDTSDLFSNRDYETSYDATQAIAITINGSSAESAASAVTINGSTITITDEGTYLISGALDDGMLIVDAEKTDKIQLVLDGVTINSETSAALYIKQADKVFVTIAEGSENLLSNGGSFVAVDENNIDAALYSRDDLTLNGAGTLTVESPAGHGIVSKDDLVVTSGDYKVSAASQGFDANDSIRIVNGNFHIISGKDSLHSEHDEDSALGFVYILDGRFTIEAEGDGISASAYLQVENGVFDITAGGGSENGTKSSSGNYGNFPGGFGGGGSDNASGSGETETDESASMKGLKATAQINLNGGVFTIDSADDAVHSNGTITIDGGRFAIATGDDSFHADERLTINAGTINISESYEGLEALDVLINGGEITLVASDDGINAAGGTDDSGLGGRDNGMFGGKGGGGMFSSGNGSIVIAGGTIYIQASGDGIDANGTLEISGGFTRVAGPTQGDTATLDFDKTAAITGGTFIGTGASGMAQTFSSSEQGVIAVSVGTVSAGTTITLADSDGNVIIEDTPELDFAVVILSSPEMVSGETYTITVGSQSGSFQAN